MLKITEATTENSHFDLVVNESLMFPPGTQTVGIGINHPDLNIGFTILFTFRSYGEPNTQEIIVNGPNDGGLSFTGITIGLHKWDDPKGLQSPKPVIVEIDTDENPPRTLKMHVLYKTALIGDIRSFDVTVWAERNNGNQ